MIQSAVVILFALCRCTAPLGSPHAVVQFVASNRADVVNLALNTSYLISEVLIFLCILKIWL